MFKDGSRIAIDFYIPCIQLDHYEYYTSPVLLFTIDQHLVGTIFLDQRIDIAINHKQIAENAINTIHRLFVHRIN